MTPLPSSDDKEFWGDNEVLVVDKNPEQKMAKYHYLEWQDGYAVCTSCPYKHTVPIDPNKFDIVDGEVVIRGSGVIK